MTSFLKPLLYSFLFALSADAFVRKSIGFSPRNPIDGQDLVLHARSPQLSKSLHPTRDANSIVKAATAGSINQLVDHFSTRVSTRFTQRYWYNSVYHRRGGPVFLSISGENEANTNNIENVDLPIMQMARSNNAMLFLLEHRYYGESRPTKDMSTANLKYLSSRQALEDIAAFIEKMNAEFNLTNSKWITFGGSYAGSLSAWVRAEHPKLVTGAVSSSGPMLAQVNYIGLNEVVQAALKSYSPICASNVQAGFVELQKSSKTATGKANLKRTFSLCNDLDTADDITQFYDKIISNYRNVVIYGGNNMDYYRDKLTIAKICEFHVTNTSAPLLQLGNVNSYIMGVEGYDCLSSDYEQLIETYKTTTYPPDRRISRTWLWQQCTELGHFHTTDSPTAGAFFGQIVPVSYYVKQCTDVFGSQYNNRSVYAAVDETNSFYGGINNFEGTRVVFTNGGNDPWHKLGILTTKRSKYTAVLIPGTAHCADAFPPSRSDVRALTQARKTVASQVAGWVGSSGCIIC